MRHPISLALLPLIVASVGCIGGADHTIENSVEELTLPGGYPPVTPPASTPGRLVMGGGLRGYACAIRGSGQVYCWGVITNASGTLQRHLSPTPIAGLTDVQTVSANQSHICAVQTDGSARCWERNSYGELGDGTTADRVTPSYVVGTDFTRVATSGANTCAVRADNTIWCWGYNADGELGGGSAATYSMTPVRVAALP